MAPAQCRFFSRGNCNRGSQCKFSHGPGGLPLANSTAPAASNSSYAALVDAVNGIRSTARKDLIPADHRIFRALEIVISESDTEELEEILNEMAESFDMDDMDDVDEDNLDSDYDSPSRVASIPQYPEPQFSAQETVRYLYSPSSYSYQARTQPEKPIDWTLLDQDGVRNIEFGPNFSINDDHIQELINRPALCAQLQRFHAGDSDTGNGGGVRREDLFMRLVRQCCAMRVFYLEAFTQLSDATLLAIFHSCQHIEKIHLSGNDKVKGKLTGTALQTLAQNPSLAPSLKILQVFDQRNLRSYIRQLSIARPTLQIMEGETLGDGMAANVLAAMTGGAEISTWIGGKIVTTDVDEGFYGSGGYDLPDGIRESFDEY